MSQELKFPVILGVHLTRLSKPRMGFTQDIDLNLVPCILKERDCPDVDAIESMNDVASNEIPYDNLLLFNNKFGYLFMDEVDEYI